VNLILHEKVNKFKSSIMSLPILTRSEISIIVIIFNKQPPFLNKNKDERVALVQEILITTLTIKTLQQDQFIRQ
jgi:hypothetical protein